MSTAFRHWCVGLAVLALCTAIRATESPQPPSKANPAKRATKSESVARDLVVEMRERAMAHDGPEDADAPAAYSVSTLPADGGVTPQQVRVQSGEKAMLRLVQSTPMQWMQAGQQGNATLTAGPASATHSSSGISQATTLVESGQMLMVTPHWAGANRPVRVELQWQSDSVAERTGAELPATTRRQVSTTVRMPLQQWVTIATRGATPSVGSYSSSGAMEPRRALQLRVSLP